MGLLRFIFFWYWAFCLALLGRRDDDFTLFQAVVRLPHPGSKFPGGRYRAVAPPVVGAHSDAPDSRGVVGGGGGGAPLWSVLWCMHVASTMQARGAALASFSRCGGG